MRFLKQILLIILISSCSNMLGDFIGPTVSKDWEISVVDNVAEDNSGDSVTISWPAADEESHGDGKITYEIYITEEDPTYDTSILTEDKLVFREVGVTEVTLPKAPDGVVGFMTLLAKDKKGNETIIVIIPISLNEDLLNSLDEDGKFNPRPDTLDPLPGGVNGDGTITALPIDSGTVSLSWDEATDDSVDDLEYKVVISLEENIESINDALNNGTLVCDWTSNIDSFEVTNLKPDTTYWYNVLVRDSSGNISIYRYGKITTPLANGSLDIKITLGGINDLSITFLDGNSQPINGTPIFPADETITLRVPDSIGTVTKWIVDNDEISNSGNTLILDLSKYQNSINRVTVVVVKDNIPYSTQLKFHISVVEQEK